MPELEALISVSGILKRFGKYEVLKGINLEVPPGCIFGLLGINGQGKTTLIRILLGLLRPDGGSCRVAGIDPTKDPIAVRRRVGYMAENQTMYGWMRVGQLIEWVAKFYPEWDATFAEQFRREVHLDADKKVGTLSKGQTSRLALLLALAHHPQLVILDDPTLGLDPIARKDFLRDVIGQLQSRGVTVFFSSHLLYEIEPICDRVAILHGGQIIQASAVDELRESVKRIVFEPVHGADLRALPGLLDIEQHDRKCTLTVEDSAHALPTISAMSKNGITVVDLNLDEIFEAYVIGRREVGHV